MPLRNDFTSRGSMAGIHAQHHNDIADLINSGLGTTRQDFTATAGQTAFTLSTSGPAIFAVSLNGLILDTADYTVSGTTLTLTTAAQAGDALSVLWGGNGNGGSAYTIRNLTTSTTVTTGEFANIDATSGALTITLTATPTIGQKITVRKSGTSGNRVTVQPSSSSVLIDDVYASLALNRRNDLAELLWDGTRWVVMRQSGSVSYTGAPYITTTPLLWLAADLNVYYTTYGGTAAADGQTVAAWGDQAASRYAAASGTAQPILHNNGDGPNGKPYLRFDGSDDQMVLTDTTSILVANPVIFVVAKAAAAGGRLLIGLNHNASGWTAPYARWHWYIDGTYNTTWNGSGASGGTWSTGDYKVLHAKDGDVYANGTRVIDRTDADVTYPNGATPLLISGNGVGSERWNGDICEILIYNNISDADVTTVKSALATKYAITVV